MNENVNILNSEQQKAVTTTDGPLLVLAGAGSGKTKVLTYRIAYLIENKKAMPYNILAITFTNKAAQEMRDRVEALVGEDVNDMWVRTFHSACVRILRKDIEKIGYGNNFNIIDADDQKSLIKNVIKDLNLDDKKFPPKVVLGEISRAKEKLVSPENFENHFGNDYRMSLVARIYGEYQKRLNKANCLDFDDLILKTVELFEKNEDVLSFYQKKFRYILVDEYQDTNHAQYRLISLLAKAHRNLCVVGDDDQSIYKFRGADIKNILDFEKEFPEATVIRLEQNYRSTQNILSAANAVIKNNTERKGKNLWSDKGSGEKITDFKTATDRDEAYMISSKAKSLFGCGRNYKDMAVLYRTNAQSRVLEEVFMRSSIPYRVLSGLRFYERMEVKDIISYLKLIKNPDDNIALMRVINVPSRKVGKATLDMIESIANRENTSMFTAIKDHLDEMKDGVVKFYEIISSLLEDVKTLTVDEIVQNTIEKTLYEDYLKSNYENFEDRKENISQLVSGAADYMNASPDPSFSDYMDNLALISDIDNYDETADAMSLMTIHTAKGLEFPVVFLCGMDEGLFPSVASIMDESEVEEERRLCYVGITRAKEELYLSGAKSRMMYGKTTPYKPSRFMGEIPSELITTVESESYMTSAQPYSEIYSPKTPLYNTSFKMPKTESPKGDISFKVGDRVKHIKFGEGIIINATPVGSDMHYEIAFESVGTKNLLGLYAKLERVD